MWSCVYSVDKCTGLVVGLAREVKGLVQYTCVFHVDLLVTEVSICTGRSISRNQEIDKSLLSHELAVTRME